MSTGLGIYYAAGIAIAFRIGVEVHKDGEAGSMLGDFLAFALVATLWLPIAALSVIFGSRS